MCCGFVDLCRNVTANPPKLDYNELKPDSASGFTTLLITTLYSIVVMALFKCINAKEIRESINWEVLVSVAAAFGIQGAMTNSGLSGYIGDGMVQLAKKMSGDGETAELFPLVFALYVVTNLLSAVSPREGCSLYYK